MWVTMTMRGERTNDCSERGRGGGGGGGGRGKSTLRVTFCHANPSLDQPLPKPPHDSTWVRDAESGEYRVVKKDSLPEQEQIEKQEPQTAQELLPEFM